MEAIGAREVWFGLRCPDDTRDLAPTGQIIVPDYSWINVLGGATTIGYYDPSSNDRHKPLRGPGQDLLSAALLEIDAVVRWAFGDSCELHVRSVDLYLCSCKTREDIEYHRIPTKLDVWEQAPATIMNLLKINKIHRSREGKKLILSGLVPRVYPEKSVDTVTWPGGFR